jgi:uncharacterized Zn finger protein (UPF0148 family)
MGQKVVGQRWCPTCNRQVMAVKNMHRVRNAAAISGAAFTGGMSLLLGKREKLVCPTCGTPTLRHPPAPPLQKKVEKAVIEKAATVEMEKAAATAEAAAVEKAAVGTMVAAKMDCWDLRAEDPPAWEEVLASGKIACSWPASAEAVQKFNSLRYLAAPSQR